VGEVGGHGGGLGFNSRLGVELSMWFFLSSIEIKRGCPLRFEKGDIRRDGSGISVLIEEMWWRIEMVAAWRCKTEVVIECGRKQR